MLRRFFVQTAMPDKNKVDLQATQTQLFLMIFVKDERRDVPGAHKVSIYQKGRKYRRLSGVRIILVRQY